jgi:hypothetical protein
MGPKHEEDQLSRPPGKRWSGNEHGVDDDEVSQATPPLLLGVKEIHPTLNVLRLEGAMGLDCCFSTRSMAAVLISTCMPARSALMNSPSEASVVDHERGSPPSVLPAPHRHLSLRRRLEIICPCLSRSLNTTSSGSDPPLERWSHQRVMEAY